MGQIELYIHNSTLNKTFAPIVKDNIIWETQRQGAAGRLSFTVVKDKTIDFSEGDAVIFKYKSKPIFFGYVFSKSRDKEQHISVVAYDQLRYMKNKQTYVYTNKTASEVLKMVADDFQLKTGSIEDTKYKIASKIEENTTLFDIIQNAMNDTLLSTNELFVLYDDFGKLALKNIKSMKIPTDFAITEDTVENFEYKTDIDSITYNKIILYADDKKTNQKKAFVAQDADKINKWGV